MCQVIYIKDYLERKIERTKKERDKIRKENTEIVNGIEELIARSKTRSKKEVKED